MEAKLNKVPRNVKSLPTVRTGAVKVHKGRGVRVNYVWYWAEEFDSLEVVGSSVPIRYDPYNACVVYTFIKGHWVSCFAKNCSHLVSPFVEEVKLAFKRSRTKPLDPEVAARIRKLLNERLR